MSTEYELFKGKSLSSLFEDIYNNSKHNKHQLEVLVKEVTSFIKGWGYGRSTYPNDKRVFRNKCKE